MVARNDDDRLPPEVLAFIREDPRRAAESVGAHWRTGYRWIDKRHPRTPRAATMRELRKRAGL